MGLRKTFLFMIFLLLDSFFICPEASKRYNATIKVKNDMNLNIFNKNGNVVIEQWDKDTIEIEAVKFSWSWEAREEIDNVEIIPTHEDNDIFINVKYGDTIGIEKVAVYFKIKIPSSIKLKEIENYNGRVEIKGGRGDVIISTSNGRIDVSDYIGNIEAYTSNGGIYFENIEGNCLGETSNAKISVKSLVGDVDFNNTNSNIYIESLNGKMNLNADSGNISISSSKGRVAAKTSFGKIKVFDSVCHLDLFSSFGSIEVNNVEGFVNAKTGNGNIEVIETTGILNIETINGNIVVDVINLSKNGSLVKTGLGSITAYISTNLNATVRITNYKGKIDLSNTDIEYDKISLNQLTGVIGKGSSELQIETKNGKIEIYDY